ncbi:MAG: DUF3298 domain-containing protein [Rubricoccaceae bacterium]|nr:DUF3298 domain-containing protein [Rubricoccaceae bacterium]
MRTENEPESRLVIDITYPQLNPSARPELSAVFDIINADIVGRINARADTFLVWARDAALTTPRDIAVESSLEGGFSEPFTNDRLLSVQQHFYSYVLGAAHPNTTVETFNYDLSTGEAVHLEDLFESGTAYLDALSSLAHAGLIEEATSRGFAPADLWSEGYAPTPENFAHFTLHEDSLALHFPPYAVAPYVAGEFEIRIPYTNLTSVLRSGGPASSLAIQ